MWWTIVTGTGFVKNLTFTGCRFSSASTDDLFDFTNIEGNVTFVGCQVREVDTGGGTPSSTTVTAFGTQPPPSPSVTPPPTPSATPSATLLPAPSVSPSVTPLLKGTYDDEDEDDDEDYVGVVMLDDFNEIITKIMSSKSSPNINFVMQPPPGGLVGSQLLGGPVGSHLLGGPGQGPTYLAQALSPGQGQPGIYGQIGQTGQVGNINIHQKQTVSSITSIASEYFPSILEGLKNSNAELDKQSNDFKNLNNKFRDMNKIQSSISLITAKIKLPETEKVTSYIIVSINRTFSNCRYMFYGTTNFRYIIYVGFFI
jgi:hypothetical protein